MNKSNNARNSFALRAAAARLGELWSKTPKKVKIILSLLFTLFTLCLAWLGALDRIEWLHDKHRYGGKRIAIVGTDLASEEPTWAQVEIGIDAAAKQSKHYILRHPEALVRVKDNDPEELCKDSTIVLAIGYIISDAAHRSIKQFLNCGSGTILPMIIIGATETKLTDVNREIYKMPMLRLPPSNRRQAGQIVAGLHDTFGANGIGNLRPRIRVILGQQNRDDYAEDLLMGFKQAVARTGQNWEIDSFAPKDSSDFRAVAEESFRDSGISAVLFFGMTDEAASLLHTKKHVLDKLKQAGGAIGWARKQVLILSDGSTNRTLTENPDAECSWGLFPFGDVQGVEIAKNLGVRFPPASYMAYGADAIVIADEILQQSDSWSGPTRESIAAKMKDASETKETFPGILGMYSFGRKGELQFFFNSNPDEDGEVEDLYHFLQLRKPDERKGLEWFHRPCATSLLQCAPDDGCRSATKPAR
jgi:hypothetical protein